MVAEPFGSIRDGIVMTDTGVEEWKKEMGLGQRSIARRERMRSLEHKIAIEAACTTIKTECRPYGNHDVCGSWWYEHCRDDCGEIVRRHVAEAVEYLDLCGLIERMDRNIGPMVRIRHEDLRR